MTQKYITIQDAAELSGKSVQTIRRAIKAKKITCRKQRTPQGFNYLVSYESVCETYKLKMKEDVKAEETKVVEEKAEIKEEKVETKTTESNGTLVSADDFKNFTKSLDRMINQHAEERQNFMRLVNTLQEKIFVLENQLNLLREPKKNWYQFWR